MYMAIKIALIISIALQFIAAIVAISLIKRTRYNITWLLVSSGLVLMAIRRIIELMPYLGNHQEEIGESYTHWIGVVISLVITIGVFYIRRIFRLIERMEHIRSKSEQRIVRAIIRTEENERKKFAKELHDGMGPLLSSIKMSVSGLKSNTNEDQKLKIIKNIDILANEALVSVKEISNQLSPHILNNFGIHSAVKSFIEKISDSGKINIVFNSNIAEKRIDFNSETIIYRVICELVNNTLKHADAKNINIDIWEEDGFLKIYYFDDGVGFDVKSILKKESVGMGYSNITTRLKSINGTFKTESEPGKGVHISIQIELQDEIQHSNN